MSDGLGLILSDDHEETINSFDSLPTAFGAVDIDSLPSEWSSPVQAWNQGATSSCCGHAGAANFTHRQWVETGDLIRFSPWYSYLTSQRIGGFFGRDAGTSIKSVIDAATQKGCCLESLCPRPDRYSTVISQAAIEDAATSKHMGAIIDLRNWQSMIDWITDRRSMIIGTRWMSTQRACTGEETKRVGSGGSFLGNHARAGLGFVVRNGEVLPKILNSHGTQWGKQGWSIVHRELWDWWISDSSFCALGFTDITEREPARRSWATSSPGDSC